MNLSVLLASVDSSRNDFTINKCFTKHLNYDGDGKVLSLDK